MKYETGEMRGRRTTGEGKLPSSPHLTNRKGWGKKVGSSAGGRKGGGGEEAATLRR